MGSRLITFTACNSPRQFHEGSPVHIFEKRKAFGVLNYLSLKLVSSRATVKPVKPWIQKVTKYCNLVRFHLCKGFQHFMTALEQCYLI